MISPINHAAGVWPVVLTPFRPDGKIDFPAYRKLLEYYIAEGVAGLFAVCLSSELYQLTPSERLELAREAVAVSGGRVPVVACGYLGNTEAEKLQSVFDMAALGMDAVVIPVCLLVPQEAGDEALFAAFETLLAQTAEIRLGIYECPLPYHRLIPPQLLGRMAHLSEAVIGLTIVAVGTSLPELATSLVAAARGEQDIAVGNVVGSNLFNMLGIMGIAPMIRPVSAAGITPVDWGMLLVSTLLLVPFMHTGRKVVRREGAVLLALYCAYIAFLAVNA
mgnify:CR=1 FL=1